MPRPDGRVGALQAAAASQVEEISRAEAERLAFVDTARSEELVGVGVEDE